MGFFAEKLIPVSVAKFLLDLSPESNRKSSVLSKESHTNIKTPVYFVSVPNQRSCSRTLKTMAAAEVQAAHLISQEVSNVCVNKAEDQPPPLIVVDEFPQPQLAANRQQQQQDGQGNRGNNTKKRGGGGGHNGGGSGGGGGGNRSNQPNNYNRNRNCGVNIHTINNILCTKH